MSMEAKDGDRVAVTLFPLEYPTVEMIAESGEEILQPEFSDAQLFAHSIHELERVRSERKTNKKRKVVAEEPQREVIPAADGDEPMTESGHEGPSDNTELQPVVLGNADEEAVALASDQTDTIDAVMSTTEGKAAADHDGEASSDEDGGMIGMRDEDVIDPRIHYRPMVAELQASVIELNQLINTIDLIRRREYLEDMQCIRENTAENKSELEYLVESKTQQLRESSRILLAGVDALTDTVEKEAHFFEGVTQLIHKWKVCAPIHGNIPKPFRAGEPLAVDCSYVSAGSTFAPPNRPIADLAFAEVSRTEKGLVCIKTPEEYWSRTVQVHFRSVTTGATGSYTLPPPTVNKMTKAALDRLKNTPDDLKILESRNMSVLNAVQFSVFCEELFYTVMQEALHNSSHWGDTALGAKKPTAKRSSRQAGDAGVLGSGSVEVLEVLDDEVRLRLRGQYELSVRLLDANRAMESDQEADLARVKASSTDIHARKHKLTNGTSEDESKSLKEKSRRHSHEVQTEHEFLRETSRFALLLLQQEIRCRHGRKEISRGLLFSVADGSAGSTGAGGSSTAGASGAGGSGSLANQSAQHSQSDGDKNDSTGTLATVISIISHNLLKEEIAQYLDKISATLAFQGLQTSATGHILEDGLNQPICDSVRGIYVSPRWKVCPYDATLTAFDLNIGKNFTTEVTISGTKIRFEDGPGILREVSDLSGLTQFVEKMVCSQVALALHRDLHSFAQMKATVDLDRASVRLFASGDWDGRCLGDGRVPDTKPVAYLFFEPYFTLERSVAIRCVVQAVALSSAAMTLVVPRPEDRKHATVESPSDTSEYGSATENGNGTGTVNGNGLPHENGGSHELESESAKKLYEMDWLRIPGDSDTAKIVWLLQNSVGLPSFFRASSSTTS